MKGFILRHGYFIPGNDGIELTMDQSECHKKKYGKCPIEEAGLFELYFEKDVSEKWEPFPDGSEDWYCLGLAQNLIKHGCPSQIKLLLDRRKGKAVCVKGRHILCVCKKLNAYNRLKLYLIADVEIV